jgi:hypothetical protein
MAQPQVVKHTDGVPVLTRAYTPASTSTNNAIAEGDFVILSSGNLAVYATNGTKILGLAEGYDTGSMRNGIVPSSGLDATGQYVNGAFGPTTSAINRRVGVLKPADEVRMLLTKNLTYAEGDALAIVGSTGAWTASNGGGTGATNQIAILVKLETQATASVEGVGLIRFLDSALIGGD